jgi:hypothetical protein
MNIFYHLRRPATLALLALAAAQAVHAVADPRKVVCAQPCTIQLKAAKGFIDIKVPTASGNLKTLYNPGDRFDLEAGKEYVLFLNESVEGWFSFELLFTPKDGSAAWSCRVKTIPEDPFIRVDQTAWSGPAGKAELNVADRTKTFLNLDCHS